MCRSKAEGGQRCYGHALLRMTRATTKFLESYQSVMAAEPGSPERRELLDKAMSLERDLHLARVEYASTPQGEADLRWKLRWAVDNHGKSRLHNGKEITEGQYEIGIALRQGLENRERNEKIRRAGRNQG